jgi:hypothetical protein
LIAIQAQHRLLLLRQRANGIQQGLAQCRALQNPQGVNVLGGAVFQVGIGVVTRNIFERYQP